MNYTRYYLNGSCVKTYETNAYTIDDVREVALLFATVAERDAFAAEFPKACKVRSTDMCYCGSDRRDPMAIIDMSVCIDKRTGVANETAQRRRDKIIEVFNRIGFDPITEAKCA